MSGEALLVKFYDTANHSCVICVGNIENQIAYIIILEN